MLSSSHSLHGVAFTLSGSQVYGTDLFGRETSEYKNDDPKGEIPQEKPKYEITPTPSDVRITPSKAAKELINGLTERMQKENKEILTDKLLKTTAQKHANYMSANKTLTHLQSKENKNFYGTTAVKRHAKTKYGFWKLLKPKITNLTETIALLEIDEANYDHEKILNQLWEELEIFPKGYTQLGLSIKIRRNKDQLEIYAVLLLEE